MSDEELTAYLEREGYRVTTRSNGWCECMVSADSERWFGAGPDEDAALADALTKMFPSRAARALLDARLRVERDVIDEVSASVDEVSASVDEVSASVAEVSASVDEVSASVEEVSASVEEVGASVEEVGASVDAAASSEHSPAAAAPSAPEAPRAALAKLLDERAEPALEALDELHEEVCAREVELALAAPLRQRLVITGWIADARRAQDQFPSEERVRTSVARIAGKLSSLCRVWWCGSVRALQVNSRPDGVLGELPYRHTSSVSRWDQIADITREMYERIERDDASAGRDEHGWADGAHLFPAPKDPDAMLREVVAEIDAIAGPTGAFPPRAKPDAKVLARWVARLRWLRGSPISSASWAYALGRCRYWIHSDFSTFREAAALIDPQHRPDHPWAALHGAAHRDRERSKLVREIFSTAPAVKDAPGRDAVEAWLIRALALADTHQGDILSAVTPFRDAVLAIDAATDARLDRCLRRRLTRVQRALGGAVEDDPVEAETDDELGAAGAPTASDVESLGAESELLADAVRTRTRGARALFISNRTDPQLRDRLLRELALESLDWCEADLKRSQSAEQKVAAGAYDFVLAATGFLSHNVDTRLAKVCRAREIPYVRVERGRPLTCVRSLARDLGIHP